MSMIHAKTNRPASTNAFLREALALFNSLPDEIRHHEGGLLGEALTAMKREAEARALLSKRYEYLARTYGEQNPSAVRTRQQLDRLGAAAARPGGPFRTVLNASARPPLLSAPGVRRTVDVR